MRAGSVLILLLFTAGVSAQRSNDVIAYINTYRDIAIAEMQRTGVPAAIKLAQGIHETSAGTSELVRKSNNHFGIKCKTSWAGEKVYHDDDARGECFRSYTEAGQSYKDHSDFLKGSQRYAFLFQLDPTDYKSWANGLRKAGYATNYRYAQILIKLIEDYNLEQYTLIAMGKLPPVNDALVSNNTTNSTAPASIQALNPSVTGDAAPKEVLATVIAPPAPVYPAIAFSINKAKVVFVQEGTALLAVAEEHHISFARLLDFNDLNDGDITRTDQLIFLQRKRKTGANEYHTVQPGETLYYICQAEGIRLESLLANNLLTDKMQPAVGEKLYLQAVAPVRPLLDAEKKAILKEPVMETLPKSADTTTHVVQTKETLYSISKKYGVSLEQLKTWNRLDSLDVKIGQQLMIHSN
ncbi:MAG: glucosaminidase domain-containing protein [Chitinophagaceae bacterium]